MNDVAVDFSGFFCGGKVFFGDDFKTVAGDADRIFDTGNMKSAEEFRVVL